MANEVKDWKAPDCSLTLKIDRLSNRETFSAEINKKYGEGGGLNANYRTMEAGLVVANILGMAGLEYKKHFFFKTAGLNEIIFDFCNQAERDAAERIMQRYQIEKATNSCPECGEQLVHQEGIIICPSCGYQKPSCC